MQKKQRILVVEDDEIMQRALAISLERVGFEVICTSTLEETEQAFGNGGFAVVITDIYLPDGDGLMVLALAREKQPNTPVVGITSYLYTELGQKAKQVFGERLFEKPFKKNEFIRKIKEVVSSDAI